ncbi:hypothetical protein ACFYO1_02285 [Nocardia sp. NPDC006044]|uniref:hypothetical protein n=1 Tax=Nocardia sp. NPDC006044 TaxID=3364306 RepID=UPI00367F009E
MTYLLNFLIVLAGFARTGGLVIVGLVSTYVLIAEAAKSKLSAARIITVAASAILAGVVLWILPSLINYARYDVSTFVPDYPIGGYR